MLPDWRVAFGSVSSQNAFMLSKRVGENIRRLRDQRNYSLERVAQKVSRPGETPVRYSTIARLEKGDRKLTLEWLERIADALNVEPTELISGSAGPDLSSLEMSEQVANEVARTLALVAREGEPPEPGTVQALSLMLQELAVTFLRHPQAYRDPSVARPVLDLAGRRHAPAAS